MKTKLFILITFVALISLTAKESHPVTEAQFLAQKPTLVSSKSDKDVTTGATYLDVSVNEIHSPNKIKQLNNTKNESLVQVELLLQVANLTDSPIEIRSVSLEETQNIDLEDLELLPNSITIESRQSRPLQILLYAKESYKSCSFKYSIEYVAADTDKSLSALVSSSPVKLISLNKSARTVDHDETQNKNANEKKISWNKEQVPKSQKNSLKSLGIVWKKKINKGIDTYHVKITNTNNATVSFNAIFPRGLVYDVLSYPNAAYNGKKLGVLPNDGNNYYSKLLLPASHVLGPNESIEVKMWHQNRKPHDKELTKSGRLRYTSSDWRTINKALEHIGQFAYLEKISN